MQDYGDAQRFEAALSAYTEEGHDRREVWDAFKRGWHARVNAARTSLNRPYEDAEDVMILDLFKLLEDSNKRLSDLYRGNWLTERRLRRQVEQMRVLLRDAGKDPADAPLARRISEQRKQLKAQNRAIAILKHRISELEEQ